MEAEVSPAALRAFRRAAQKPRIPARERQCGEEACVYEEAEAYACGAWVPFSWEERPGVPLLVEEEEAAFTQSHAALEAMRGKREGRVRDPQPQQSPAFAPPSEHASSHGMLFPLPPPPTPLRHNAHASSPPAHAHAHAHAHHLRKPSSNQPSLPSSPLSLPRRHRASSFPPFLDLPSAAGCPTPKSSVWPPIPSALNDDPFLRAIQACTQSTQDCRDESEEHNSVSAGSPKGRSPAIAGSKEGVDLTTHIKHRNAAHLRALAKDAGINGADPTRSGTMRGGARDNAESYGGSRVLLGSLVEEPQQRKGATKGKVYEGHPAFIVANIQQAQPSKHAKPRAKEARRHERRSTSSNHGWSCRNVNYHDTIVRIQNPRVFSSPAP